MLKLLKLGNVTDNVKIELTMFKFGNCYWQC